MVQIAEILKTEDLPAKQAASQSLQIWQSNLSKNEIEILNAKYSKPQICKLADTEIMGELLKILPRIHVITGWNLPNNEEYLKILAEELLLKFKADFSTMNFDEIVLAFRQNGIGVKDWGKNMNLELVSSVICAYLDERLQVSADEERVKAQPSQTIYTDEQLDNLHRADIENFYQRCRSGKVPPGIPSYFLPMLIKDGFMAEGSDDVTAFFVEKLNSNIQSLYKKQ